MNSGIWNIIDEVGARAGGSPSELDGRLNAVMELVADVLPSADGRILGDGCLAAAHALALIMANGTGQIDRNSAGFQAGRMAAIVDILGYAASATAASEDIEKARTEPYATIIRSLADGPLLDGDVAERSGIDAAAATEGLPVLRVIGMTTNQMQGLQVYNVLTPVGFILSQETAAAKAAG